MSSVKIGWIGLGHMGTPMSLNLVKAGYNVSVYNRSSDKLKPLIEAGAKAHSSVSELCVECDIIFTMLSDDEAVKSVYADILTLDVTGKLFVNMSTISPDTSKEISSQCLQRSARYLEAPVSGSVKPAMDGTLVILAGGNEADYDMAIPFFERLGKLSLLLGEVGMGASAKLAINYYLAITVQGLAETTTFAASKGIDKECMMLIINQSACGSPISMIKTPSIINDHFPPAFPLRHMAKDVRLACEQGLKTPLSQPIFDAFQSALTEGLGDEDVMAVIKTLKK